MLADTDAIRHLAGTIHEHAAAVRELASRLRTAAETVPWEGLAADAMRHRVREQVNGLHWTAVLADEAAETLRQHAAEVEALESIATGLIGLVS